MATTNYNLPTILGTNVFDLVTDYNALSNAVDGALAQLADTIPTDDITELQGQVSALQTTTAGQTQSINQLTSQMTTANDNISGLTTRITNAENSIGSLQTGLQTANSNISQNAVNITTLNNAFVLNSTQYRGTEINASMGNDSFINVLINYNKTILNVYGRVQLSSNMSRTAIPGTSYYGVKTNINTGITSAHVFDSSGITTNSGSSPSFLGAFAIGSDGYIYLLYKSSASSPTNETLSIMNAVKFIGTPAPFSDGGE